MAYRLYRRDPVKMNLSYYAVTCKGCGRPIYLLDDRSNGAKPAQMQGDGELSVPCLRCMHDDIYPVSAVFHIKSDEDLIGARPERVPITKASRKPMWKTYPNARVTIGVGYVEDRPAAAAIIGRIITSWADIEVQCTRLLANIMNTDIPAVAAMFGSLKSSRAQHDALEAAARVTLDDQDFELFTAHMVRRSALEKERNDLAHGCFGVSVRIPDHVIWVAQADYLIFTATYKTDTSAAESFRKKQFVYEIGTLERIAQEIEELYNQLKSFSGYVGARRNGLHGATFREKRYPQLCSQSHIRQALDYLRIVKKASKAPRSKKTSSSKRKR